MRRCRYPYGLGMYLACCAPHFRIHRSNVEWSFFTFWIYLLPTILLWCAFRFVAFALSFTTVLRWDSCIIIVSKLETLGHSVLIWATQDGLRPILWWREQNLTQRSGPSTFYIQRLMRRLLFWISARQPFQIFSAFVSYDVYHSNETDMFLVHNRLSIFANVGRAKVWIDMRLRNATTNSGKRFVVAFL